MGPHDIANTFVCKGTPLYTAILKDWVEAKEVDAEDVQRAGLTTDDRWRGWEWRDVFMNCSTSQMKNTRGGGGELHAAPLLQREPVQVWACVFVCE